MATRDALPTPGTLVVGRYRVTRRLGSGGMGAVYEAEQVRLGQRVAIKVLLPELCEREDVVARFEREARTATKLTSAHAARVTDVDTLPSGTPFLVMEYLEGKDLAAELQELGPLPIHVAVDYVLQACDAMAEAHAVGIVHRDLKPGNLFITKAHARRTLKVLDFGISKVATGADDPGLTSTFSALGTAHYMSPEQVRSAKRVDHRTDIWSLGVILYELLAGKPPFEGESATAVAAAVVADPIPSVRILRPEVSPDLERVLLGALAKSRDERYPDIASFATALGPFASDRGRASIPSIPGAGETSYPRITHPTAAQSVPPPALANGIATAPGWAKKDKRIPSTRPSWMWPAVAGGAFVAIATSVLVAFALVSGRSDSGTTGGAPGMSAATTAVGGPSGAPSPITAIDPAVASSASSLPAMPSVTGPSTGVQKPKRGAQRAIAGSASATSTTSPRGAERAKANPTKDDIFEFPK